MIHRCCLISRLIFIFVNLVVICILCILLFIDNPNWHFINLSILLTSALLFNSIFALFLLGLIVKFTVCEDVSICALAIVIVLSMAIWIRVHQLILSSYWFSDLVVDNLAWLYIWLFYYLLIHHWTCILPSSSDSPYWSFYHFI